MTHPTDLLPPPVDGVYPGVLIGLTPEVGGGEEFEGRSPIDGSATGTFSAATPQQLTRVAENAASAFREWRKVPAPQRGEVVRMIGEVVRQHKAELAQIITLESGKIRAEAEGEVQEWIDVCDFAVGLSRQLYGNTIASERPQHSLVEHWHPLGPVGVISAFNFPAAVWAWNSMVGLVCGDTIVWKPSEQTPLTALACQQLVSLTLAQFKSELPSGISSVVIGGADVGAALAADERLPLISATGSIPMGRKVAEVVGKRLGKTLLELGGNNGMIVTPTADLAMGVRAITFAAVGTCGQRCTSLRRIFVHSSIAAELTRRLTTTYAALPIGDPRDVGTLVGPLVNQAAYDTMQQSIAQAIEQGGRVVCGGKRVTQGVPEGGAYVEPCLISMPTQTAIMHEETFAPLTYLVEYDDLEEAIEMHNAVPQGLSSAIFTGDVREAHQFMGPAGSDCGLVGVNIGTSGAEIGGAFGGEKQTGGGRESGSDSWKQYMRRATCTINYGTELPLSQGIRFGE